MDLMNTTNRLTVELVDELKSAPRFYLCQSCGGSGAQRSLDHVEETRGIMDTCYHCTDGLVDEETHFEDCVAALAGRMAYANVQRRFQEPADECDNWHELAAESGLSPGDFKRTCIWDETEKVAKQLAALDRDSLEQMLASHEEGIAATSPPKAD